ncbi:hypothetical protein DFS33DRAFT_1362792 [Desarmillaria ectypa]|nr:hypothetical protein DFS33DRAFT_1362792 [Desarmillaria ectypa]
MIIILMYWLTCIFNECSSVGSRTLCPLKSISYQLSFPVPFQRTCPRQVESEPAKRWLDYYLIPFGCSGPSLP